MVYAATLQPTPEVAALATLLRDSLDETLRIAPTLPQREGAILRVAGAQSSTVALRATLLSVAALWFATGLGILACRGRGPAK